MTPLLEAWLTASPLRVYLVHRDPDLRWFVSLHEGDRHVGTGRSWNEELAIAEALAEALEPRPAEELYRCVN